VPNWRRVDRNRRDFPIESVRGRLPFVPRSFVVCVLRLLEIDDTERATHNLEFQVLDTNTGKIDGNLNLVLVFVIAVARITEMGAAEWHLMDGRQTYPPIFLRLQTWNDQTDDQKGPRERACFYSSRCCWSTGRRNVMIWLDEPLVFMFYGNTMMMRGFRLQFVVFCGTNEEINQSIKQNYTRRL
jgi:hypothetical protein